MENLIRAFLLLYFFVGITVQADKGASVREEIDHVLSVYHRLVSHPASKEEENRIMEGICATAKNKDEHPDVKEQAKKSCEEWKHPPKVEPLVETALKKATDEICSDLQVPPTARDKCGRFVRLFMGEENRLDGFLKDLTKCRYDLSTTASHRKK